MDENIDKTLIYIVIVS